MTEYVPVQQEVRKCEGCGDPIIWAKTAMNDKWIPLNSKPERRMVFNVDHKVESTTTWTPHHATCPKADQFRH